MVLKRPIIKIQSIWPAIRKNAEEYYNLFAPYVDLVASNPLIDYSETSNAADYEETFNQG